MAGMYGYSREAVRVKVKKCEVNCPAEWRKFSVDPQITSVEVLHSILAKAFDIRSDFSIHYRAVDPTGQEIFLTVLSDWDLDAAFLRTHNYSVQTGSEPCLNLRVDVRAFSEASDWEVNSPASNKSEISPLQQSFGMGQKYVQNMQNKLPGLIMNHVEKTFSMVQRALNFAEEQIPIYPPRAPLSDSEFRGFLDSVGQILKPHELRKVIFLGGIDPSLRRVVWKHILNVYPNGMTGRERMDYMKRKATEYFRLRDVWKAAVQRGPVNGELAYVTSMVRKDVLRTDRLHSFYAGSDDNQNIASLFNILTTYALNHPAVSYCQGMSDLASPLLVTMNDEAHAYICFCAVMSRLQANFMLDGIAMTQKFAHLSEALQYYDPEFYEYLKIHQADDLLFCYRWLLLELKREFPFEDSLRMLEVQWSSLRYEPPITDLKLVEKEFIPPLEIPNNSTPPPKSPAPVILRKTRENHYTKVCALRRQSSSLSLNSNSPSSQISFDLNSDNIISSGKLDVTKRLNQSLDENISRLPSRCRNSFKAHQSLDETKMLLLMKNANLKEKTIDRNKNDDNLVEEKNDQDQDDEPNIKKEPTKIIFHPTNPFLDDAQLDDIFVSNSSEIVTEKIIENCVNQKNLHNIQNISESVLTTHQPDVAETNMMENTTKKAVPSNKSNLISKNQTSTSSENVLARQLNSRRGGHFKDLKEKIAAGKKGIMASLDKIENQLDLTSSSITQTCDEMRSNQNLHNKKGQKVVKNFNEFLNFASNINKSRISDKMSENTVKILKSKTFEQNEDDIDDTIQSNDETTQKFNKHRPLIKLTEKSFDESDSSTIDNEFQLSGEQKQLSKPLQLKLTNLVAEKNHQQSLDGSSPDDSQDYYPMTTSITRELRLEMENLDRQVFGQTNLIQRNKLLNDFEISYEKLGRDSLDLVEVKEEEIVSCPIVLRQFDKQERLRETDDLKRISTCSSNNADIFIWENPLHQISGASSCNFNDIGTIERNEFTKTTQIRNNTIASETLIDANNQQQITPDEQQDLEYDGDIIIECSDDKSTNKILTPLRLVQQKPTLIIKDDSDSDDTAEHSWKESGNLNPFLDYSKSQELISNTFDTQQTNNIIDDINLTIDPILMKPSIGEEAAEINEISFINSTAVTDNTTSVNKSNTFLPPPNEFGGGNPFLMFLCLTLLLQHRNIIIKSNLDYNEMAMHFDKMVRKHDVNRVLNQARRMYFEYLKTHNAIALSAAASEKSKINIINNKPAKS